MAFRSATQLVALAAIWGASFVFVRMSAPALGALVVADARVLLAGLFLWLCCLWQRRPIRLARARRQYAVLGLFNAALQFGLMAYAASRLSAALTAILVATMPLWSAALGPVLSAERTSGRQAYGLLLGLAGVAVVASRQPLHAASMLALLAGLGSALAGAVGGHYARGVRIDASPMEKTIGQQLAAGLMLLPFALYAAPQAPPTITQAGAVLALALPSTGLAFLIYFRLVHSVGATRTLTVEFLVPIFAALWGRLLIDEPITPCLVVGGVIVLWGAALVNGWRLNPRRA